METITLSTHLDLLFPGVKHLSLVPILTPRHHSPLLYLALLNRSFKRLEHLILSRFLLHQFRSQGFSPSGQSSSDIEVVSLLDDNATFPGNLNLLNGSLAQTL